MTALYTRERLLELAERVEKATESDGALDEDILIALGWRYIRGRADAEPCWLSPEGNRYCEGSEPNPTASLDAAMTLVSEGWHTDLATEDRHSHSWRWELRGGYGVQRAARSSTPALALTAAALRARAGVSA